MPFRTRTAALAAAIAPGVTAAGAASPAIARHTEGACRASRGRWDFADTP
ncbi:MULTISPECIES: hypothetical protein [unclassified Streptomyces]